LACISCGLDELGIAAGAPDGERPRDVAQTDAPRPSSDASVDHEAPKDGGGGASDAPPEVSMGSTDSSPPPDADEESSGTDSSSGMTYSCGSGTTTDCVAGCPGKPVSCVYCSLLLGNAGFCGPEGRDCFLDSPPVGRGPCACVSTSGCVTEGQICMGFQCRSCGEQASGGKNCKGGGKCDEKTATCK